LYIDDDDDDNDYAYYDDRDDDVDHENYCGGEHVSSISFNLSNIMANSTVSGYFLER
jgi:hypothetical protein